MSCLVVACTDDSAFTGDQASGATPAQGADTGATSEPATDPPGVLFVQRAESGTTTIDADGSATVVLSDVDEETVWFEDRPGRGAGRTPTGDFVGSWASAGFDDDAPNGSLEVVGTDGTRSNHVVELHAPRWDADARTLTYSVSSNGEATLPAEFGASSLFIDGANPIQAVASTYQPVTLRFENVQPGQGVGVRLAGKGGPRVSFSSGESMNTNFTMFGPVHLDQLRLRGDTVTARVMPGDTGRRTFRLQLYLAADGNISEYTMSSTSDAGVAVFVELPYRDPVQLGSAPTDFKWSPN